MSDASFKLDREVANSPSLNYLKWLTEASQKTGRGVGSMLVEMTKLMLGKGKVQPENYFLYQLYDDERYTPEAKQTFMGQFGPRVESPWAAVVNDKLTLGALLRGLDLPIPETQGMWHSQRSFPGATEIRDAEDAANFLRNEARYPIFGKPLDSVASLGTTSIFEYDADNDSLVMSNGASIYVDDYIKEVSSIGTSYLFQSTMQAHPDLVKYTGDRISSVRIMVMLDEEGSHVFRASWKIPGGNNGADNFWRAGNMLAGIDVETGKITRAFRRKEDGGMEQVEELADTGVAVADVEFPHWDQMREVVLRAAANLPGCYLQGWDVALTDQGPVLVELEGDGGDPIMQQLCFDSGLMQEPFFKTKAFADKEKKEWEDAIKNRNSETLKQRLSGLSDAVSGVQADDDAAKSNESSTTPAKPEEQEELVGSAD